MIHNTKVPMGIRNLMLKNLGVNGVYQPLKKQNEFATMSTKAKMGN
jgi:hypothetical protein